MKKNIPSGRSRYFIAMVPPSPVLEEVLWLKNYFKQKYKCRAALNSPPHITLYKPFLWNDNEEDFLLSSMNNFAVTCQPMTVELSDFSSFAPKVIFINVLKNEGLDNLQTALYQFCKEKLALPSTEYTSRSFHPHLTIAFRDLKKSIFEQAWLEFKEREFKASFTFDKLSLLKHNGNLWELYKDFHF